MASLTSTGQVLNHGRPPMLSQGSFAVLSMEKATSIAKTILKYTRLQLHMEQLVLQLQQQLPMIPIADWASYCEQAYQMDRSRMTNGNLPSVQNPPSVVVTQPRSIPTPTPPTVEQFRPAPAPTVTINVQRNTSHAGTTSSRPLLAGARDHHISPVPPSVLPKLPVVESQSNFSHQIHQVSSFRNDQHPFRVAGLPNGLPVTEFDKANEQLKQTLARREADRSVLASTTRGPAVGPAQSHQLPKDAQWYRSRYPHYVPSDTPGHNWGNAAPIQDHRSATSRPQQLQNIMMHGSYDARFAQQYARAMHSDNLHAAGASHISSLPLPISSTRTASSSVTSQKSNQGRSTNVARKEGSRLVPGKKHDSILARAVLLAAGKLPTARLNARWEKHKHWLAKDIRKTSFDRIDPPTPGQSARQSAIVINKYISAALRESRASSQASTNEQEPRIAEHYENSGMANRMVVTDPPRAHTNGTETMPAVFATAPARIIQRTKAMPVIGPFLETNEPIQLDSDSASTVHDLLRVRKKAGTEPQSKPSKVVGTTKSSSTIREAQSLDKTEAMEDLLSSEATIDETHLIEPFHRNKPWPTAQVRVRAREVGSEIAPELSQDLTRRPVASGSVLTEFTLELENTTKPDGIYYNPNEDSALAAIDQDREDRLRSLDPDQPGYLDDEVVVEASPQVDCDLGFPVYRCGFWQCSAELHDFDTLVRHCDKVHGHRDNSGMYVCHWGDCHTRKIFFSDISRWQTHLDEEHQQSIRHVCCVANCKQAFPYQDDLALHMELLHQRAPGHPTPKRGQSEEAPLSPTKRQKTSFSGSSEHIVELILSDSEEDVLSANNDAEDDIDLLQPKTVTTSTPAPPVQQKSTVDDEYDTSMPGPQSTKDGLPLRNKVETHVGWNETWDIVTGMSIGLRGGEQVEVEVLMRNVPLRGREEPKREVPQAVFPVPDNVEVPNSVNIDADVVNTGSAQASESVASQRESWFSVID